MACIYGPFSELRVSFLYWHPSEQRHILPDTHLLLQVVLQFAESISQKFSLKTWKAFINCFRSTYLLLFVCSIHRIPIMKESYYYNRRSFWSRCYALWTLTTLRNWRNWRHYCIQDCDNCWQRHGLEQIFSFIIQGLIDPLWSRLLYGFMPSWIEHLWYE